jgi:hypothetical protein
MVKRTRDQVCCRKSHTKPLPSDFPPNACSTPVYRHRHRHINNEGAQLPYSHKKRNMMIIKDGRCKHRERNAGPRTPTEPGTGTNSGEKSNTHDFGITSQIVNPKRKGSTHAYACMDKDKQVPLFLFSSFLSLSRQPRLSFFVFGSSVNPDNNLLL